MVGFQCYHRRSAGGRVEEQCPAINDRDPKRERSPKIETSLCILSDLEQTDNLNTYSPTVSPKMILLHIQVLGC